MLAATLVLASQGYGVTFGNNGLHVHTAWTVPARSMMLGGHSSAYFKDEVYNTSSGVATAVTYWDVQGRLGLIYGFTPNVEFAASQIIYQDTNTGGVAYNIPDDLLLRAKFGSIGRRNGSVRLGAQLDLRLPTADVHNIPLEPYSADRIGLGVMALFSIVSEPLFPASGININANLGFYNHNDAGLPLTDNPNDNITSDKSTKEVLYGVSYSNMMHEFGFFAELYGNYFLSEPPITAYTRENSLYFTPGIVHTPNSWLKLNVGMDIRLTGDSDNTVYAGEKGSLLRKPWQKVPNLPSWRINVGATITIRSGATRLTKGPAPVQSTEVYVTPRQAKTQEALFDELARERKATENAEAELERIRAERERMENLLQRLKNILQTPAGTAPADSSQTPAVPAPEGK